MNNQILRLKLKQRLNKLASNDYDNIEDWQILEAFNKAQIEWVRRMLHGNNLYKEGDELSKRRIDDLQILLTELNLTGAVTDGYFETIAPLETLTSTRASNAGKRGECCKG